MITEGMGVGFCLIVGAVVALIALLLIHSIIILAHGFTKELKYINMEIQRTEGAEQRYWKRKKRKLWLSLIPFTRY